MSATFVVGDLATVTITFYVDDVATDPTAVSLAVTTPSGTTTTYTYAGGTVTKAATGEYTKDVTVSEAGTWRYTWTGTGAASDLQDGTFEVVATYSRYATLADARSFGVGESTVDDNEIELWLEIASRVVDDYTGTRFNVGTTPTTETFYNVTGSVVFPIIPFSGVTAVTDDGNAVSSDVYEVDNIGINVGATHYSGRTVTVTGIFGYPGVPAAVRMATCFIARNLVRASSQRPTFGTDDEGNPSSLSTAAYIPTSRLGEGSTGSVNADRLLAPYRNLVIA